MAYKALYRKYRPNSFDEIAGQHYVVETLKNAVKYNRIAHAYLFCGPRGTGKTSIAKIFAKMINCSDDNRKPCLECENCLAIKNGTHPDVIEIDAASNNGVDEVRNLIEKVKYSPIKGKYKIYIIDEVHMMTQGAFNALLKTIEEPPEHVIFILATTDPYQVIPTILSRCQRFDFNKVSNKDIENRIKIILEQENIKCDDVVIERVAQLADGGLRDALSILDQCIAYAQDNIEEHHLNEIYGIVSKREKLSLLDMIFNHDASSMMNLCSLYIEKGIDIPRLTSDLIEILKESLIYEISSDATLLQVLDGDEASKLISKAKKTNRFAMVNKLIETYDHYRFASNIGSYFEVCMLEMIDISKISKPTDQNYIEEENNVSRETKKVESKVETTKDNSQLISDNKNKSPKKAVKTKESDIKPLENEFVLSLLVGANKQSKFSDIKMFENIQDYLLDITCAKYATMLKKANIIASSESYLVVCVSNQVEANEINELDKNEEFASFIKKILQKPKKVFAINENHGKEVISEFKVRMANHTLPKAISFDVIVKEKKAEKSEEEMVYDLFGKENITVMED